MFGPFCRGLMKFCTRPVLSEARKVQAPSQALDLTAEKLDKKESWGNFSNKKRIYDGEGLNPV